jgi:hypothetical protein
MKHFIALLALIAAPAILPAPVMAKSLPNVTQFKIAPAQLNPNKAYLLMRTNKAKSGLMSLEHVFLKVPTEADIAAYNTAKKAAFEKALPKLLKQAAKVPNSRAPTIDEFMFEYDGPSNLFAISTGKFLEDGEERTYFVEVDPGTYVLYGAGSFGLMMCNCLGTVKFDAGAGMITNLGTLYLDKVSEPPEVPHLEDNRGKSMGTYNIVLGQAIVPAPKYNAPFPQSLAKGAPVQVKHADYSAVGPFIEPGAVGINRLAPIPGILGYERGKVIDLKTGQKLD